MKHLAQRSDRTKERSKSRSRKSRMEGASLRKSISRLKEHSKSRGRKERNTVGGTATTNTTIPLKGGESTAKTKYHSARRRLPMSSNQMNDYLEEFNDDSKKREFKSRPHETKNERMSPTPHIPDLTVPNTIPIVRRLSLSAGGLLNCNDDMIKTLTKEIEAEDKEKATRPVARKRSNSWDSTHQQAESNTAINTKPPAESRKDYPQLSRRSSDSGPSLTIDVGKVELGQQRRKTSKYRRTSLDNSCIVSKGRCEKKRPSSLDPERRVNQAATDIMRSSRSSVGSFDINMLRDDSDAEDDKSKGGGGPDLDDEWKKRAEKRDETKQRRINSTEKKDESKRRSHHRSKSVEMNASSSSINVVDFDKLDDDMKKKRESGTSNPRRKMSAEHTKVDANKTERKRSSQGNVDNATPVTTAAVSSSNPRRKMSAEHTKVDANKTERKRSSQGNVDNATPVTTAAVSSSNPRRKMSAEHTKVDANKTERKRSSQRNVDNATPVTTAAADSSSAAVAAPDRQESQTSVVMQKEKKGVRISHFTICALGFWYVVSLLVVFALGFWLHMKFFSDEVNNNGGSSNNSSSNNNNGMISDQNPNFDNGNMAVPTQPGYFQGSKIIPSDTPNPSVEPTITPLPTTPNPSSYPSSSPTSSFPTLVPSYHPTMSPTITAYPTSTSSSSPSISAQPSSSPTAIPVCPDKLLKSITLGADNKLTMHYEVVEFPGDPLGVGGMLCTSIEYDGNAGWIGLALSGASRDPTFGRKEAIIGIPGVSTSVAVTSSGTTASVGQQVGSNFSGGPVLINPGKYEIPAGKNAAADLLL